MPSSAVATGLVDLLLPAGAIVARLIAYAESFEPLEARASIPGRETAAAASEEESERAAAETRATICALLREQVGHGFGGYKVLTFVRRVQRRMQVPQIRGVDAYRAPAARP